MDGYLFSITQNKWGNTIITSYVYSYSCDQESKMAARITANIQNGIIISAYVVLKPYILLSIGRERVQARLNTIIVEIFPVFNKTLQSITKAHTKHCAYCLRYLFC